MNPWASLLTPPIATVSTAAQSRVHLLADDPPLKPPQPARPARERLEPLVLLRIDNPWNLTPMHCEVLRRTVEGESAKEIAAALGRSHRTVEAHHAKIVDRMNARSLLHAALMWDRQMRANATLLANLALAGKHPVSPTPAEPELQPV